VPATATHSRALVRRRRHHDIPADLAAAGTNDHLRGRLPAGRLVPRGSQMRRRPAGVAILALCLLVGVATACTANEPAPTTLRVLASSELADMQPLLDELRRDTGVELRMDYRGTVDASNALNPGDYHHDLAWLSSDRYFQLKLKKSRYTGPRPLSTNVM